MSFLDEARYPLSTVANAIGRNLSTTRSWLPYVVGGLAPVEDKPAKVAGSTALYTARTVLQLGIASYLIGFLTPKAGCYAASHFTHLSSPNEAPDHHRDPGELFSGAGIGTALVAYRSGDSAVVRFQYSGGSDDPTPFSQLFFPLGGLVGNTRYKEGHSLYLNFIVQDVETRLKASISS